MAVTLRITRKEFCSYFVKPGPVETILQDGFYWEALRYINIEPIFSGMNFKDQATTTNVSWVLGETRTDKILRKIHENAEIFKFHAAEI